MTRFEATRGLVWGGYRKFEPQSDDEDDTRAGFPSPNFRTTPTGGRLTLCVGFNVQQAHISGGSSVESGFEPGTLRPRGRDLTNRGSILVPPVGVGDITFPVVNMRKK
ncbi:hypothetical protein AVEN_107512-1 [Araneus ventricosus]|uniref:Uncharacterized protein n=1 Tax=Araneus ventricosus TaxID=182803 RepID=A0A4Y2WKR9_ARAVE|nr:hypothetical protein AVEN_107512-1 [Araneus ventricosus]